MICAYCDKVSGSVLNSPIHIDYLYFFEFLF